MMATFSRAVARQVVALDSATHSIRTIRLALGGGGNCRAREGLFDDFQKLPGWLPFSSLPPRKGAGIDFEPPGKFLLGDAQRFSMVDQSLRQGGAMLEWISTQEFDDFSRLIDARFRVVILPVHNRHFIAPDDLRHIILSKS